MPKTIALITDFGLSDHFVGVMKGVIADINPSARIIDVSHGVQSCSIVDAQFTLYSSYKYFPEGTIFCVVVDPGVGTARKALIAKEGRRYFVLPDNGILPAVYTPTMDLFTIKEECFNAVSATFNSRDILAPAAAFLSLGRAPGEFADPISDYVKKKFPDYTLRKNSIDAMILHIDKFGNVIISVPKDVFDIASVSKIRVYWTGVVFDAVLCTTYDDLKDDEAGMLVGSSGFYEFSLRGRSFSDKYRASIGEKIQVSYEK